MAPENPWLLIETLDQEQPSVIAAGSSVKKMVPMTKFFGSHRTDVFRAVASVCTTARPYRHQAARNRVVTADPICDDWGRVHAVWLRVADPAIPDPGRNRAWAFVWNLTRGIVTKSKGLVPEGSDEENEPRAWSIAEAFNVLETGLDATETLVKVINADIGTTHQTTWPQHRAGEVPHDVNFAVRIFSEPPPDSLAGVIVANERILRGVSHDLGPTGGGDSKEAPVMLAELVAATAAEPDEYRAIVDIKTARLLRWYGEPPEELDWEYNATRQKSRMHPEDRPVAEELIQNLDSGRAEGTIRLLTRAGSYEPYHALAKLILLDRSTTAALVTLRKSDG